jgi:excisionase family DNA binding protein
VTLDELLHDPELARSLSRKELAAAYQHAARLEADLRALLLTAPTETSGEAMSKLLTLPAAAAQLGVPKSKLYELARRGELPVVKLGKYVRVRTADLEKWIDAWSLPVVTHSRYDRRRVSAAPRRARL